jgi:hypothetical protein
MARIFTEISRTYPSLGDQLSRLPENERSDSRTMRELGSYVVELFEGERVLEIRPAFEFVEQLIADGTKEEQQVAVIGFLETVQKRGFPSRLWRSSVRAVPWP